MCKLWDKCPLQTGEKSSNRNVRADGISRPQYKNSYFKYAPYNQKFRKNSMIRREMGDIRKTLMDFIEMKNNVW